MRKNNRVKFSTGTISDIDCDKGSVEVSDASGRIIRYTITPPNLFDTDGHRIAIDELQAGDQVTVNETGHIVIMKVFKIAAPGKNYAV